MGKHCGECPMLAVKAERDWMQENKTSTDKKRKDRDTKWGLLIRKEGEDWYRKLYEEVPFKKPASPYSRVLLVVDQPSFYDLPDAGWEGEKLTEGELMSPKIAQSCKDQFALHGVNMDSFFVLSAMRCYQQRRLLDRKGKDMITEAVLKKSLTTCREHLLDAIRVLKPTLIITMGDMALKQVTKAAGLTKKRGKLFLKTVIPHIKESKKKGTEAIPGHECWVFPTFSPSIVHTDQSKSFMWEADIRRACDFIKHNFVPTQADDSGVFEDTESIRELLDSKPKVAAFDTETQGLDYTDPNSLVISYSVSTEIGKGYNIWLYQEVEEGQHTHIVKWERGVGKNRALTDVFVKRVDNYDQKVEELRELLQDPDIKLVMMNGNYDLHRAEQLGIPADTVQGYVMDVGSAAHAWDSTTFKNATLGDIQSAFCPDLPDHKTAFGAEVDKSDMLFAAKQDPIRHTRYAVSDTSSTLACALEINRYLATDPKLLHYYKTLAHPVDREVLYQIEKNGVCFDRKKLPEVKEEVAQFMALKEREFKMQIPTRIFNKYPEGKQDLTKSRFISDILYSKDGWNLKPMGLTPTGLPAVGRKLLIRQRDELPDDHPAKEALNTYIEWGPYKTLHKTFLMGFDKCVQADGRLHISISKTFTETGRCGARRPNLQQIPKRNKKIAKLIRSLLVAPDGYQFVAADESQAELRWIAHRGQEREFARVYKEGKDIHTNTAEMLIRMGGNDPALLSAAEMSAYRTKAKAVNFGLVYGMQANKFQSYARDEYGVFLTLEEAEAFRTGFFALYQDVLGWHTREIELAKVDSLCRSDFGFVRRLPNINSPDFWKRAEAERAAVNTVIQSASSDTTLLAALEAVRSGLIDGNKAYLALFIHDDVSVCVKEDYVEEFTPKLIEVMSDASFLTKKYFGFDLSVPFLAEAEYGKSLGQMTPWKA